MMTKTQILELENEFKRYKIKQLIKKGVYLCLGVFVCCVAFYAFTLYKDKQNTLKIALEEKRQMQKRLDLAKVEAQKAQILAQKRELIPQIEQEDKEKITIHSYAMNAQKLKKQFYKRADFKTALKLANLHLVDKDYEKALFWSLKANELNKNEQDSWLIFAKAKFALGEKDEAKRVLQGFMSFYGNISSLDEVEYILK